MIIRRLTDQYGLDKDLWTGDGANGTLTFTLKDNSANGGAVINITGWTVKLTIKEKVNGTELTGMPLTGTISVGTDGVVSFDFSSINFTSEHEDAVMTIYRVVSGKNRPLLQYQHNIRYGLA